MKRGVFGLNLRILLRISILLMFVWIKNGMKLLWRENLLKESIVDMKFHTLGADITTKLIYYRDRLYLLEFIKKIEDFLECQRPDHILILVWLFLKLLRMILNCISILIHNLKERFLWKSILKWENIILFLDLKVFFWEKNPKKSKKMKKYLILL